jgi:predicted nucleic acid-binding protein
MTFVDTNYFLRFLLNDVESQHKIAKKLFVDGLDRKIQLATSLIVYFEIYRVLVSFYKKDKKEISKALRNILKLSFIKIPDREILFESLKVFDSTNFDLEDCFNIAYAKEYGAKEFMTFDQKLAKQFKTF